MRRLALVLWLRPAASESCEGCYEASFNCQQPCGQWYDPEWKLSFEFQSGGCWEQFPMDDRRLIFDLDIWCSLPETAWFQPPLTCSNFELYDFSGIADLEHCEPVAFASSLIQEDCQWYCKVGRPAVRCTWTLGHEELYEQGETLHGCNRTVNCMSDNSVRRDYVCRPDRPLDMTLDDYEDLLEQKVETARQKLEEAEAELLSAEGAEELKLAEDSRDHAVMQLAAALDGLQAFQASAHKNQSSTLAEFMELAGRYPQRRRRGGEGNLTSLWATLEYYREALKQSRNETAVAKSELEEKSTEVKGLRATVIWLAMLVGTLLIVVGILIFFACRYQRRRKEETFEERAFGNGVVLGRPVPGEPEQAVVTGTGVVRGVEVPPPKVAWHSPRPGP